MNLLESINKKVPLAILAGLFYLYSLTGTVFSQSLLIPGEKLQLTKNLTLNQESLLYFYSPQSRPCQKVSRRLERYQRAHPKYNIIFVNIDRANAKSIDLNSPVAKQYKLSSVPAFVFIGQDGTVQESQQQATKKLFRLLASP